jgi:hypothetical protein
MTSRYPYLYRAIQGIAGLLILLNFIAPVFLQQTQLLIAVLLIVLIGIPHGATDYLIFKNLSRPLWGGKKMNRFLFQLFTVDARLCLLVVVVARAGVRGICVIVDLSLWAIQLELCGNEP